jgi:hypothetical protein
MNPNIEVKKRRGIKYSVTYSYDSEFIVGEMNVFGKDNLISAILDKLKKGYSFIEISKKKRS